MLFRSISGGSPFWPRAGTMFRRYRATGIVPERLAPELPLSVVREFDRAAGAAVRAAGGRYVSLVDQVCDATTCATLVGGRPLSIDGVHITLAASRQFAKTLVPR